jgi:hypothetical protein
MAAGGWRSSKSADAGVIEEPVPVGEAKGSRLPVVNLDGDDEPTGGDVRADRVVATDAGAAGDAGMGAAPSR